MLEYFTIQFWTTYYFYESLFVISVIAFALLYKRGSKWNHQIASIHFKALNIELAKYFKNIGTNDDKGDKQLFYAENPHIFKMYSSKHPFMNFCLVSLYLKHRENVFNYYGYDFIMATKERLLIEIGVMMSYRSFVCFGIVKQSQIKKIKKEGYEDLKTLCNPITYETLDSDFQVLSEFGEVADIIMTEDVIQLVNQCKKYIHLIYISDVDKDPASKVQIRTMCNVIQPADYEPLIKLMATIAQKLTSIKLDTKKMNQAINTRRKFKSKNE